MDLTEDIEPVTALTRGAADLISRVTERRSPAIITQNDRPTAVLQDVASYERQGRALHLLTLIDTATATTTPDASTTPRPSTPPSETVSPHTATKRFTDRLDRALNDLLAIVEWIPGCSGDRPGHLPRQADHHGLSATQSHQQGSCSSSRAPFVTFARTIP